MGIVTISALSKAKRLHGRKKFQGLAISIENRVGSVRRWRNPDDGSSGAQKMAHPYGYIRGTVGMDGDHVDCYVGPHEDASHAYVITQTKAPDFKELDEQKVMLGFESAAEAKRVYLAHMNDPRFFLSLKAIPMAEFKAKVLATSADKPMVKSAGPFMGPRGGLWADPQHTIPWKPDYRAPETKGRNIARIDAMRQLHERAVAAGNKGDQRYTVAVLKENGVDVHKDVPGNEPPPVPPKLRPRHFHATPASAMAGIAEHGLRPRSGRGTFNHGGYDSHSQGKVFLSDNAYAASQWHSKVGDMAEYNSEARDPAVLLRMRPRAGAKIDPVGAKDVSGSVYVTKPVPPEHLEFYHPTKKRWVAVSEWDEEQHPRRDSSKFFPESEEELHGVFKKSFVLRKAGPFVGPRGGKWADAKHTIPWHEPEAHTQKLHGAIFGEEREERVYVSHVDEDTVRVSQHSDGKYGPTMPRASLAHFRNDLAGLVKLPAAKNADINAVIEGKAKLLGKGDDGIVFRVGERVVKVSTTVPFQPFNAGHRSPEAASAMLRAQVEIANKLADEGVPGLQRSTFIAHGDKGFQIKPYVTIPDKLLKPQLDSARDSIKALHDKGYALRDDIQIGVEADGRVVLFDIGKVAKAEGDDREADLSNLSRLYRSHGFELPGEKKKLSPHQMFWEGARRRAAKLVEAGDKEGAVAALVKQRDTIRNNARITDADLEALMDAELQAEDALDIRLPAWPKSPAWMRGNLGIERKDMPQIKGHRREQFLQELRDRGIRVESKQLKAGALHATQKNLKSEILEGARVERAKGAQLDKDAPILVSEDNYVLDGHHRWGAVVSDTPDEKMNTVRIGLPIRELLAVAKKFEHVEYSKSMPRLYALASALLKGPARPPAGYTVVPRSRHGGFRKRVGDGWVYWYPTAAESTSTPAELTEAHFRSGHYDKTPSNWHFVRAGEGRTDIHPWTSGGVDPHSQHPVKIAGRETRLYQIVDPEPEKGWAKLRDVNSGDEVLIQHERVYPVEHGRALPKAAQGAKPRAAPAAGPKDDVTAPPRVGAPAGWIAGSDERIPPFAGTARKGTALHKVEGGVYPRKRRVLWRQDADGLPHKVEDAVLAMPEGDKVALLGEMQGLVRKAADRARRKLGVAKTAAVSEDLQAAAMEGLLHAVDNYRGGYSFVASAMSYAEQYARLQAAREFSGGFGMSKRDARLMPGFLAARAEANRTSQGEADATDIARRWTLRKRDRHEGLETGKNDPIPMNRYSLRSGEIVSGTDKPGKVELAQAYLEFVDGQRKGGLDVAGSDGPVLPGPGVGYMGAAEQVETEHALGEALQGIERFDVVVDRSLYRVNAAEVLRRRLGLSVEPQSTRQVAGEVPIYRIARGGDLKQLSPRAAFDVLDHVVAQALDHIRDALGEKVGDMVERAKRRLVEPPLAARGPTVFQRLQAASREVSVADVRAWRASERLRLRKLEARFLHEGDKDRARSARNIHMRIASISTKRAKLHIAEQRILLRPATREWFKSAIATAVDFADPRNEYGHATITMTDLGSGKQKRVRVRTMKDFGFGEEAYKSETAPPDIGMLRLVTLFPRLSHALWGSDDALAFAPSTERDTVLEAMGLV